MFMVFSKEKFLSYLISLSTVALLFVLSFAITKKNDEIIKTSANAVISNTIESSEMYDSGVNPNDKEKQNTIQTNIENSSKNIIEENNSTNTNK